MKGRLRRFIANVIMCAFVYVLSYSCKADNISLLSIQENPDNKDALVSRAYSTKNYGKLDILHVSSRIKSDSLIDDNRALIYFNTDELPWGSEIDSAFIIIKLIKTNSLSLNNPIIVERLVEPWSDENVNWKTQPKSNPTEKSIFKLDSLNQVEFKIKVTEFIKGFAKNKYRNLGFLFRIMNEKQDGERFLFHSFESKDPNTMPELRIHYRTLFWN